MKKLAVLLTFLLLIPQISLAQQLNYLGIENQIISSIVMTHITLTFNYATDLVSFTLPIFSPVLDFQFNSTFDTTCTLDSKTYGNDILCDISKITPEKRSIEIFFNTSGLVETNQSQFIFKNDVFIPTDIDSLFYQVILPEGNLLVKDSPFTPNDALTTTDGRRIFVFWNEKNVTKGETFSPRIRFEPSIIGSNTATYLGVGFLIVLFFIGLVLWRRKSTIMQIVLPILKDDEKLIYEAVLKHGSGVNQKVIVHESNYSKAKVSKVLKNLQERGILRLERLGRSNKVHIVKDLEKKEQNNSGNN